jgi:hypothetical protein
MMTARLTVAELARVAGSFGYYNDELCLRQSHRLCFVHDGRTQRTHVHHDQGDITLFGGVLYLQIGNPYLLIQCSYE